MDRRNPVVSVRIPQPIIDRMDSAIATGMYRNRADYIMAALRQFDDGLNGKGAPGGGVAALQNNLQDDQGD